MIAPCSTAADRVCSKVEKSRATDDETGPAVRTASGQLHMASPSGVFLQGIDAGTEIKRLAATVAEVQTENSVLRAGLDKATE